jgi:hypothetical protein
MTSGALRRRLILLPALLAGALLLAPGAALAKKDCIKTYNKKGEVTGEYCADGLTDPAPGGGSDQTADGAPAMVDPGPAPDPAGTAAKARKRSQPKGIDIRCSAAQKAAGQRCLGVFDLSL